MNETFIIPADILRLLKKDATTWKNFQAFSEWYRRIRIGFNRHWWRELRDDMMLFDYCGAADIAWIDSVSKQK